MATTISVTKSSVTGFRILLQVMKSARRVPMPMMYAVSGARDSFWPALSLYFWGYVSVNCARTASECSCLVHG